MVVTTKTVLLTLLSSFLLFISAITLGLRGSRRHRDDEEEF